MDKTIINDLNVLCEEKKVSLGKLFQEKRKSDGITLYTINKNTGLSYAQIQSIESGDKDYTFSALIKYCNAIDLTLISLM